MKLLKQKKFTIASLVTVFAFCFALAAIRGLGIFNKNICVINRAINSHITNFIFSLFLCVLIGYVLLVTGKKFIYGALVGVALVALNFVYETMLPFLNTTDTVDAYYGAVGAVIGIVYLFVISKFGFVKE